MELVEPSRISKIRTMLCLQVLVSLGQASSGGTNPAALRQSVPQDTVTGLFRDMRGIAIATNSRRTYGEPICAASFFMCARAISGGCPGGSAQQLAACGKQQATVSCIGSFDSGRHCHAVQACCLIGCIQRTLQPSWQRLRLGPTSQR